MQQASQIDTRSRRGQALLPREMAERLEPIVTGLIEAHEQLVMLLEQHRAAITRADAQALGEIVAGEQRVLERIEALGDEARGALGAVAGGGPIPRISTLARAMPEPEGPRLAEAAAYLRSLAARAQALQRSVREASESIVSHMNGLMRQVAARLSHAGTYSAGGRVEGGAGVVSGLDVRL